MPAKEQVQGRANCYGSDYAAVGSFYFLFDRHILRVGDIYCQNTYTLRDALYQQALHLARAITLHSGMDSALGIYPELKVDSTSSGWILDYQLTVKTEGELTSGSAIEIICLLSDGVESHSFAPDFWSCRKQGDWFATDYGYRGSARSRRPVPCGRMWPLVTRPLR